VKIVKRVILLAIILCLMTTVAFAAEEDYVYIASGEYYDTETESFVYMISQLQDRKIYSNIPNGTVTTDRVSISVEDTLGAELYRDGALVSDPDFSNITQPGGYTFSINGNGTSYQPISFQIVAKTTGLLQEYTMPDGFSVTGVTLNGTEQNYNVSSVEFQQEGEYVVDYASPTTGKSFRLEVTIDHTPPTLLLANVNEKGVAKGPVDISDVEKGATIYILQDGKEITAGDGILDQTGDYHIILTDAAGNTSEYVFRISVYFNTAAILSFVILAAAIIVLCTYLSRERKKMRVR